ncbi:hypothetical protein [Natranaerobius thermophilus]|uniref:Serine dehydratase alpha chain n=1 Tax=Natranaerobius thermophilus (strain ATCC BAA-1301 / DSM 18059 / JW/NM-WN-LF) TaxID=457570 RepID=B2A7L7_NATTJ|nr:hypothetical protein [Natranaerobius thermophilus]ACB85726.1 hypothetical protein Nther_2160 [Natranaerobius thermophilus JW/NM-WN-LF]
MSNLVDQVKSQMPLTLGELINIARENNSRVVDVVLAEAELQTNKSQAEILEDALGEFEHNLKAVEIGLTSGESLLFGTVGDQLLEAEKQGAKLFEDDFINDILTNTLAAQVGNHTIGVEPCAGTGDSCPYTGIIKAMKDHGYDIKRVQEVACVLLKVGSMFRVGKTTTGCNMEGFGAGAAASAAAFVEIKGGNPDEMEKAMVLALSPTIANPCTPRVMVPGLCATHIGGAVLLGNMSAGLAINTSLEVNVPVDVMIAMASEVHKISAKHVVPSVIKFMEPFFKTKAPVEQLIDQSIKDEEETRIEETGKEAKEIAKGLAKGAKPITETLGEAVVGGSSQAVGSPTNAGRIAHYLTNGNIKGVTIELYPELFARRGINVPGILMGAVFGASTSDYEMYQNVMKKIESMGIEVEVKQNEESQIQRVTIETDEGSAMVDTLNRGGGRLVLRDATPSLDKAKQIAEDLGIVLVD